MLIPRDLEPAGTPRAAPHIDLPTSQMDAMVNEGGAERFPEDQAGAPQATGRFGALADAGGDAMRSMSLDPLSAMRQTLGLVRRRPYLTALLMLACGAVVLGVSRS